MLLVIAVLFAGLLSGCSNQDIKDAQVLAKQSEELTTIRVAKQFGLVYALLMVAENDSFLKYGLKVEWLTLGSGGAVREAMAANELDVVLWESHLF